MRFVLSLALFGLVLGLTLIGPARAAELDRTRLAAIPSEMKRFVENNDVAGMVTVVGTSRCSSAAAVASCRTATAS